MACYGSCWAACGSSCSGDGSIRNGGDPNAYNPNRRDSCNYVNTGNGPRTCSCGYDCAGCGGCKGGCSGCSGDCTGCSGGCGGSCSGSCSGSCKGCTGCTGYCKGTCQGLCKGSCSSKCTNTCGHVCNVTCSNSVAKEAYKYLSSISKLEGDWLTVDYISYLLSMIQEEGRRRLDPVPKTIEETLTKEEKEKIGLNVIVAEKEMDIEAEFIKKIIELLKNNAKKTISNKNISQYTIIEDTLGLELKEKAIKAYNEKVAVNTTSQQSYEAS